MANTHHRIEDDDGAESPRPLKRARTSTEPDGPAAMSTNGGAGTYITRDLKNAGLLTDSEDEEDTAVVDKADAPRASDLYLDTVCEAFQSLSRITHIPLDQSRRARFRFRESMFSIFVEH